MLLKGPKARINALEACSHDWIQGKAHDKFMKEDLRMALKMLDKFRTRGIL